ncbi:hypothetical protein H6P81_005128 [Aristolochia fimbriata]|uniref:Man1/Src1-like C-terminal domain-containing protein n=1 Tax=Aristolochia fimbriata TaxID=158543 RepID=A0AAV7EUM8_ARIFI|nr:hypothetical protein H6P81_005128 [Aristolochia fimbriata]
MSAPARKRRKSAESATSSQLPFLREPSPGLFPSKAELVKLLAVVAIASSVAVICNYAATVLTRPPKPFCDSDEADDLFSSGLCEPCPENAVCSDGRFDCIHGYRKEGKVCVEDGEVNQAAKKISDWVESRLCEAYAHVMCDGLGMIWFQETEILKELEENKLKQHFGFNDEIFMYARKRGLENVQKSLDKRETLEGLTEFKCPERLAEKYKPLLCCVRQWIYRNVSFILPILAMLAGLVRIILKVHQRWHRASRVEQLYEQACEILEENALAISGTEPGEPWVVASQLRDHLLLPKERKDPILWRKVEELIQEDSRVDQYPMLVKGEQRIVWEWQVKGSLSSRMRSKKAASKTKLGDGERKTLSPLPKLLAGKLLSC